jgi:hypothetical protein
MRSIRKVFITMKWQNTHHEICIKIVKKEEMKES